MPPSLLSNASCFVSSQLTVPSARLVWLLWTDPETKVPYNYRKHIQSWIYSSVLRGTEIGQKLHNARYTLYNFALIPQMPEWRSDGLISLNGTWELHIGSAYREVLALVQTYAVLAEKLTIAGIPFESIEVCAWPLQKNKTQFNVGPITIIDKKTKQFLHWDDPQFNEAVCAALVNRYRYFYSKDPEPFSFSFVFPPRKKLIQYLDWNYVAYSGICKLEGSTSLREFAQQVGLGMRPSAGFGMLF